MPQELSPVLEAPSAVEGSHVETLPEKSMPRRVFNLAWPVIGENFLETMLGIVDTLFVAQLGAAAIAGVGSSLQVMFFVISALSALSIGGSILVAQAVGANDYVRASHITRQALIWSVFFSIPLAFVGYFFSDNIIAIFGVEADVALIGTDYLQVTMATVVVLVLLFIGSGALRGAGDSRTPLVVTAIANVVNIGLDYVLIFGYFGFPELGAVGSAWATFLARLLALGLLLWAMWRGRGGVSIGGRGRWWPEWAMARRVMGLGIPAATEQVLISAAFFAFTIVVAKLGTEALAAQRIAFNALSVGFLPGIGFSIAATALVGQSVGARKLHEGASAARIATLWAILWMGGIGVVVFLLAPQLMGFFTDDATVIAIGADGLRAVALSQPFWAILFVQSGSLRGLGKTGFPLRVNAVGMWAAVLLSYLFLRTVGGSLGTVWMAFLVTSPFQAALLWWRFRREIQVDHVPLPVHGA